MIEKKQDIIPHQILVTSLPESPVDFSVFDNFDVTWHPKCQEAKAKVYAWIESLVEGEPGGIVLWSKNYGCGKTHLAQAAYRALGAVPTPPYGFRKHGEFITSEDFFQSIRDSYAHGSPTQLFKDWEQSPYLIMDDFGKEYAANMEWAREQFYKLINRIHEHKSFLLTSNLTPAELGERIGGASMSRLIGMCGPDGFVDMSDIPDYRVKNHGKNRRVGTQATTVTWKAGNTSPL
jgi:DNA replication protein DnaC